MIAQPRLKTAETKDLSTFVDEILKDRDAHPWRIAESVSPRRIAVRKKLLYSIQDFAQHISVTWVERADLTMRAIHIRGIRSGEQGTKKTLQKLHKLWPTWTWEMRRNELTGVCPVWQERVNHS